jgi:hypothetical protein
MTNQPLKICRSCSRLRDLEIGVTDGPRDGYRQELGVNADSNPSREAVAPIARQVEISFWK